MSGAKRTPGEWRVVDFERSIHVANASGATVASVKCVGNITRPRHLADMRLIAAAPDMLDVLERLTTAYRHSMNADTSGMWDMARAAIAKAKGGSDGL